MKSYKVKEIFGPTIQGEGSYQGTPVVFLRLAGCNRWSGTIDKKAQSICYFCDTDFVGGESLSADEIVNRLQKLSDIKTLVISGGEPTLQLDDALLSALRDAGYTLHLETNGSKNIDTLVQFLEHISCSPKQAMSETKLAYCDDLKLLYPQLQTVDNIEFIQAAKKGFCRKQVYLQPIVDTDDEADNMDKTIAAVIGLTENSHNVRISIQAHKYLKVE